MAKPGPRPPLVCPAPPAHLLLGWLQMTGWLLLTHSQATRMFTSDGVEMLDETLTLNDGDVVFVSSAKPFKRMPLRRRNSTGQLEQSIAGCVLHIPRGGS